MYKFFLIFVFFFFFSFYFSKIVFNNVTSVQEIEKKISPNPYLQINVKYKNQHGNFLVFYDINNTNIYVLFRVDKWDFSKNFLLKKLHRGWEYRLQLEYIGAVLEAPSPKDNIFSIGEKIQKKPHTQRSTSPLRNTSKIYVTKLLSHKSTIVEKLRF